MPEHSHDTAGLLTRLLQMVAAPIADVSTAASARVCQGVGQAAGQIEEA